MPWLKGGDNAATYPKLMMLAGDKTADERTVNEAFGWLVRCALQSAGHLTDYRIDLGTAYMLGGSRTPELIRICKKTGLVSEVREGGHRFLTLIEDPDFLHIRLKREVEHDRQQRNDTRDPRIMVPVLLRDGAACRWCGVLTQKYGRRTGRAFTFDHLEPGARGTVETVVVACLSCNSSRKDAVEEWAAEHELLPAPEAPFYPGWAATYLTQHGHPVQRTDIEPPAGEGSHPRRAASPADVERPGSRPGTAPSAGEG